MTMIAPSILSADFGCLLAEVQAVAAAGADWIHIDVMDGQFVPNLSIGLPIVQALRGRVNIPLDVHLMITQPERFIEQFSAAGADLLVIHAEATPHLHRAIAKIKELGLQAGLALNPHTPLDVLDYLLPELDLVLLMSVDPGFGGQKFIPATLAKITALRQKINACGAHALIQVDGGINAQNAAQVIQAGADVLVAGSAVFGTADYAEALRSLRTFS